MNHNMMDGKYTVFKDIIYTILYGMKYTCFLNYESSKIRQVEKI